MSNLHLEAVGVNPRHTVKGSRHTSETITRLQKQKLKSIREIAGTLGVAKSIV